MLFRKAEARVKFADEGSSQVGIEKMGMTSLGLGCTISDYGFSVAFHFGLGYVRAV